MSNENKNEPERTLIEIAEDVYRCADAWESQVCLIGNVRAHEIKRLAEVVLSIKGQVSQTEVYLSGALSRF